jgi:hypothetical protein
MSCLVAKNSQNVIVKLRLVKVVRKTSGGKKRNIGMISLNFMQ